MSAKLRSGNLKLNDFLAIADKAMAYGHVYQELDLEQTIDRFDNEVTESQTLHIKLNLASCLAALFRVCQLVSEHSKIDIPHRLQLAGAAAIYHECILHMENGQGKTLTAALAAVIVAKTGRKVHISSDNNYLIQRDATWMYPLFEACNLKVTVRGAWQGRAGYRVNGSGFHDVISIYAGEIYKSDIVYAHRRRLIHDYQLDNKITNPNENRIQKKLDFIIIDEADSTLIDNALTPIRISHQADNHADEELLFRKAYGISQKLVVNIHFEIVDEIIYITDFGRYHIESNYGISLYRDPKVLWIRLIERCLRVQYLFRLNIDYAKIGTSLCPIEDGRIQVDTQYSNGIQQALIIKENLPYQNEGKCVSEISVQSFIRRYKSVAGMSGSILPVKREVETVYDTKVIAIPNLQKVIREDASFAVLISQEARNKMIVKEACKVHDQGRPVLIGIENEIDANELSKVFLKAGVAITLLTATNHKEEAKKIELLGREASIVISAKLAGRGTDIRLSADILQRGGLHVIVAGLMEERVESQLRGRAGRQGQPGSSSCYIGLDDPLLLQVMANIQSIMRKLSLEEDEIISHNMITNSMNRARHKIMDANFLQRNGLYKSDTIVDGYRKYYFDLRNEILTSGNDDKFDLILRFAANHVNRLFDIHKSKDRDHDEITRAVIRELTDSIDSLTQDAFKAIGQNKLLKARRNDVAKGLLIFIRNSRQQLLKGLENITEGERIEEYIEISSLLNGLDRSWEEFIVDCEQMYARANRDNIASSWLSNWVQDRARRHFLKFIGTVEQVTIEEYVRQSKKYPIRNCLSYIEDYQISPAVAAEIINEAIGDQTHLDWLLHEDIVYEVISRINSIPFMTTESNVIERVICDYISVNNDLHATRKIIQDHLTYLDLDAKESPFLKLLKSEDESFYEVIRFVPCFFTNDIAFNNEFSIPSELPSMLIQLEDNNEWLSYVDRKINQFVNKLNLEATFLKEYSILEVSHEKLIDEEDITKSTLQQFHDNIYRIGAAVYSVSEGINIIFSNGKLSFSLKLDGLGNINDSVIKPWLFLAIRNNWTRVLSAIFTGSEEKMTQKMLIESVEEEVLDNLHRLEFEFQFNSNK